MLTATNLITEKIINGAKFNGRVYAGFVYLNDQKKPTAVSEKSVLAHIFDANDLHVVEHFATESNEDRLPLLCAMGENLKDGDRKMIFNIFRAVRKSDDPKAFCLEAASKLNSGMKWERKEWVPNA